MRRSLPFLLLLLPSLLLAWPRSGAAEIVGSPHDLYRHGYFRVPEEKLRTNPQCLDCHFVPAEDLPQLWEKAPPSLAEVGALGILCASCHDGISMVDRNVDAGLTVFHPDSHRLSLKDPPARSNLSRIDLPDVVDQTLSCTSCHDPHNQTYRPFLRVPLGSLCQRCHQGRRPEKYGVDNEEGDHPVGVDPFDTFGGASPIEVGAAFSVPFPAQYPLRKGSETPGVHWKAGGHLVGGSKGKVECYTCHAFHGAEGTGPAVGLLATDPVRQTADLVCEGCHRGKRGDGEREPPYPNPGGTTTGRTYHPVDNDLANQEGWISAIADTSELTHYLWGAYDTKTRLPALLCTTCHVAHGGMPDSPNLAPVADSIRKEAGVKTFCEICHRNAPPGHHGYSAEGNQATGGFLTPINATGLGHTFGTMETGRIYCSSCHRAHNAGYGRKEVDFIPILVDRGAGLCEACHQLGVSHFLGDPTLPSTYGLTAPHVKRTPWPGTGQTSYYEGEGAAPSGVTCTSCHSLASPVVKGTAPPENLLLAPAGEDDEWTPGSPDEYLCTGCHGEAPATVGSGETHPLLTADADRYPAIRDDLLIQGETRVSYTVGGKVNCHSCHLAHGAALPGGCYILKVVRGDNRDPKAIRPRCNYVNLCRSCHPY